MAKQLSVLFVTPEVFPFSNETTVAEYSYTLTLALRELGHDVRIMMPKFGNVSERKNKIHDINRLKDLPMSMGDDSVITSIKSSSISNPRNKVQAYITTNDDYFNSFKGAYHDQKTWKEHPKQIERFIFFSKTVIETCVLLNWFPEVIHCVDWQTAMIPLYARTLYPKEFANTKFVLSVTDFTRQGVDKANQFKLTNLPDDVKDDFIYNKEFNLLKPGLKHADHIVTVSQSYAKDILDDDKKSNGLNAIIKKRKKDTFTGITNRVDSWTWNPEKDPNLEENYNHDFEEFKYHNKVALINEFGLEYSPKTPLIAINTKIDTRSDLKLFIDSADKIFEEDVQVVLLGPGDKDLEKELNKIEKKFPEKFKFQLGYTESLASIMEAGSDMYFILPEYASAGIKFMQACLYGSVPIARFTETLEGIAVDYFEDEELGNSILFENYETKDLLSALKKGLDLFKDRDAWIDLARNGMLEEFDWEENIGQYESIYKKLRK